MAFEAYLNQDKTTKPKRRMIFLSVSIGVHAIALLIAVIQAFWHVDELSPPNVTVTFMSAPPPPPPPPPPPKRKSGKKKPDTKPKDIVQPDPDRIVQPKDEEEPEPEEEEEEDWGDEEDEGVEGGVEGGVVGGVVGGVLGGTLGGTGTGQTVGPSVGSKRLLSNTKPKIPEILKKSGMRLTSSVKICVGKSGNVSSAKLVKPSNKLWDDEVMKVVKRWRYQPYTINGVAQPFCYLANFITKIK